VDQLIFLLDFYDNFFFNSLFINEHYNDLDYTYLSGYLLSISYLLYSNSVAQLGSFFLGEGGIHLYIIVILVGTQVYYLL